MIKTKEPTGQTTAETAHTKPRAVKLSVAARGTAIGLCSRQLKRHARQGEHHLKSLTAAEARDQLLHQLGCYDPRVVRSQLNLLGSHDTERILTIMTGDHDGVALATLLQMTLPGAPCVYYGDEIGLDGGKDPDCRRAFPWDETAWHQPTRELLRRAITLRKAHRSLRSSSRVGWCHAVSSHGKARRQSGSLPPSRPISSP